jgi:hypothetical protein
LPAPAVLASCSSLLLARKINRLLRVLIDRRSESGYRLKKATFSLFRRLLWRPSAPAGEGILLVKRPGLEVTRVIRRG